MPLSMKKVTIQVLTAHTPRGVYGRELTDSLNSECPLTLQLLMPSMYLSFQILSLSLRLL